MDPIFKKMQFKDHSTMLVVNAPKSFAPNLEKMADRCAITTEPLADTKYQMILVFVLSCADVLTHASLGRNHLVEDGLFWVAYPKKSSKRYSTDISRDSGWQPLGDSGFEAVRQVAIDADWSALRFREARFIRSMKRARSRAMSEMGKKRSSED